MKFGGWIVQMNRVDGGDPDSIIDSIYYLGAGLSIDGVYLLGTNRHNLCFDKGVDQYSHRPHYSLCPLITLKRRWETWRWLLNTVKSARIAAFTCYSYDWIPDRSGNAS